MKLGVWVGLRNGTKPKGHERTGDLGLSSTWGHASLITRLWGSEFIFNQKRF